MPQLERTLERCRRTLAFSSTQSLTKDTPEQLFAAVAAAEQVISAAVGLQSRVLYELHERAIASGNEYLFDELALHLATSKRSVEHKMDLAVGLGTQPALGESVCSGELPPNKANIIINAAADLSRDHAQQVISRAVEIAPDNTAPQLRRKVNRLVHAFDPSAAEARHQRAAADSRVEFVPAPDGMAWINIFLPAPQAVEAYGRIDALARRCRDNERALNTEPSPLGHSNEDSFVPLDTWRVRVFCDLAAANLVPSGVAGGQRDSSVGSDSNVEVHVTVAASTLLSLDDLPAELSRYGAISAHHAREIARDATWRRILTSDHGQTELVGSSTYKPGRVLTRTVQHRDVTCTFPGCSVQAVRCDLDHISAFDHASSADEQTVAENLHTLCRYHHNAKTHGGWTPAPPTQTGTTEWLSPAGTAYRRSHPRNIYPLPPRNDEKRRSMPPARPSERPSERPSGRPNERPSERPSSRPNERPIERPIHPNRGLRGQSFPRRNGETSKQHPPLTEDDEAG